ncbi:ribose ABC transporter substrate-binding protein [Hungatella hathewayi]|uniref:Ribose ABC transporter substrate-binding protein n=2 Tax=Lachnospirales TaxID=3085636 RepID=A0A3E2WMB5_9FIRM|nr:ribose ABC transporter substrate-binding protein [Faecalicatena contorta]RGC27840.1 ribose ABC transporter substrate-binding protein [Hungatella hathewayi]
MAMAVTMAAGCSKGASNDTKDSESTAKTEDKGEASDSGDKKFVIGVSQGTMNHPFRVAMVDENVKYAEENYPEFECITTDGQNDSATQVQDVEDLLARGIDLLLISPLTSDALTPVCEKAMEQGIPVVTLDRNVECDVTCFIGAENKPMGVASADKLAEALDKKGKIVEIQGTAGASATIDRHDGFAEQLEKEYPDMEVIATQYCDYLREDAMTFMDDTLQRFGPGEIDAIYCHNDEMALGALESLRAAGREDEGILIVGMDGTEVAFSEIEEGNMFFTVVYPYCAPEGMQAAYEILEGDGVETRWELDTTIVDKDNVKDWIGKGL